MRMSGSLIYRAEDFNVSVHIGDRLAVVRRCSSGDHHTTADVYPRGDEFVEAIAGFIERYAAEHGGFVDDLAELEQAETA